MTVYANGTKIKWVYMAVPGITTYTQILWIPLSSSSAAAAVLLI